MTEPDATFLDRALGVARAAAEAAADAIAERAIPALKSHFTPLEVSADVFSWDPV